MLSSYAQHYGPTPVPESVYDGMRTTNVQILTGVKTPTPSKIIVVDCDGEEALPVWRCICASNGYRPDGAWICRTGSGGYHFYFSIPPATEACPGGLWDTWGNSGKGRWAKHKEVRILGDNALVIAPPSVHVDTGDRHQFDGNAGPNHVRLPAAAPGGLLAMPRLASPRFGDPTPAPAARAPYKASGNHYSREEVLAAIGTDKFGIATREWGLAFDMRSPNPNGWVCCYVPGREDPGNSRLSGSFHFNDGTFQNRKDLLSISFFDLGVSQFLL